MNRLTYLIYLGLSIMMISACQQENVIPDHGTPLAGTHARSSALCNAYSYYSKTGIVQVGTPYGQQIIVAFKSNLTLAQRRAILTQSPLVDMLLPTQLTSASGDIMSFVQLKAGTTCEDVEALRTNLAKHHAVNMVLLSYEKAGITGHTDYFNAILVKLKSPTSQTALQRFARSSKTQIISSPNGLTQDYYVLRVTKNSDADIFGIAGALNANSLVASTRIDGPATLVRKSYDPMAVQNSPNN
jgi:hypothetical protein